MPLKTTISTPVVAAAAETSIEGARPNRSRTTGPPSLPIVMAATNMVSGISLVGSLIAAGSAHNKVATILGFLAVVCATSNIIGNYLITDRMLKMFRKDTGDRRAGVERRVGS